MAEACQVVDALAAMLRCLNQQITGLERQLASRLAAHPDAAIIRSQPGLGVVLATRLLGEFGDDRDRYQSAKAPRRSPAPPRSSGPRGCGRWWPGRRASAAGGRLLPVGVRGPDASAGARRCDDAHRARGATHHQALRALGNRLVGILHGCLARRIAYPEQVAWPAAGPGA